MGHLNKDKLTNINYRTIMEYDCIIVLANEMDKEGNLNLESTSRVKLASDSYSNNSSTTLITCGWNYRKDSKLFIGDVMKEFAVKLGVPSEKIITELNSRDTVGDAFFTKHNILTNRKWKNILVVTSDYHVDRTLSIFKFIYGYEYTIEVIGSSGSDSLEKKESEKKSLEAFEQTFKNIREGNDIEIYEKLSTLHPFYNGVVYSKININF
jgi:vancomycin permeability regulator SanA